MLKTLSLINVNAYLYMGHYLCSNVNLCDRFCNKFYVVYFWPKLSRKYKDRTLYCYSAMQSLTEL
jgi:hypothetical protein